MQKAAVEAALEEGKSLEAIETDNPDLAAGVQLVKDEQERKKAPKPRGSGSTMPRYLRVPRI
jgi:hypothetical protein